MLRVVHTADWHIGRFAGPEENGQNARFLDLQKRLDEMVEAVREEEPDVTIVAGDVFHQARTWSDRGLEEVQTAIRYIRQLAEISPVVVLRGTPNHDGENHFQMLETAFENQGRVHVATVPKVIEIETKHGQAQVACLPGFDRGFYRAQNPGLSKEDEDQVFTQAIKDIVLGLKAQCKPDSPAILAGHYTIEGADIKSGQTAFFSKFEPVVHTSTLNAAGFDLVCFGHIHRPQRIRDCESVFYAGAISQLNFNDEGQKRGFYIHDIVNKGSIDSSFFELKGLNFKTIRMEDEDVAAFIETGKANIEGSLKNQIIRVLYSCTEEHNKAFNHALLEKEYYKAGAYWVQEVTPERISITVDKRSLEAEDGPQENLISYLKEQGLTDKQTNDVLELAKPIIDKAMESETQEKRAGLFMPIGIEVKNYRNYQNETFSYDGISFCTINGDNGAGKSSLFMDAVLDALFEEPREGELTGWISNRPEAKSGSIKLTFQLGDQVYRVTRTRTKKGRATLNLSQLTSKGWENRSKEKYRDTQKAINNLLGIDSQTLKACALIMQDQYGLFLQAGKEERMNILGNILGLGLYDVMEELAAKACTDSNRQVRAYQAEQETIESQMPNEDDLIEKKAYFENQLKFNEESLKVERKKEAHYTERLKEFQQAQDRAIKLNEQLTEVFNLIDALSDSQTVQAGLISDAKTFLEDEENIKDGINKLEKLQNEEKELLQNRGEFNALIARNQRELQELDRITSKLEKDKQELEDLVNFEIKPLEKELSQSDTLEQKHKEYQQAKEEYDRLEEYRTKWWQSQNKLAAMESEYNREDFEFEQRLNALESEKKNVEKKAALLKESKCPLEGKGNQVCIFLKDALEAKNRLPEIEKEIEQVQKERDEHTEQFKEKSQLALFDIIDIEKTYTVDKDKQAKEKLNELEAFEKAYSSLAGRQRELNLYKRDAQNLEKAIEEGKKNYDLQTQSLEKLSERFDQLEKANERLSKLQSEIQDCQKWARMEKQVPLYKERLATATMRHQELGKEIERAKASADSLSEQWQIENEKSTGLDAMKDNLEATQKEIERINAEIRGIDREMGGVNRMFDQLAQGKERIEAIGKECWKYSQQAAGYEILKKAFSQDGIPHNIIRSIIPVLESSATNILGQMSGGNMSVEFITEKTLKSNSKKEVTTLDIVINDAKTGPLPYKSRSGGEKVKAALSVILALSEVKQKRVGVQFGFLMIDEAPFLDANATQAYCDALEAIQKRYQDVKVMAITHDESFKARFPQSVTVYKDEGGSHVRVD